jgi:hypothetical protein
MSDYKTALDGAKAVKVSDDSQFGHEVIVVWYGGTTFNVFVSNGGMGLVETDMFTLCDKDGRSPDRDTAVRHMEERLERET